MTKYWIRTTTALWAAVVLASPAAAAGKPLRVVTTIPPLAMLAAQIGGESVVVRSLLAAGADPHTYEPRPSDAAALQDADIVISLGSSMDDWLGESIRPRDGAIVVRLDDGDGCPAAQAATSGADGQEEGDSRDPHIWLDPLWVRDRALVSIGRVLAAADRDDAEGFGRRQKELAEELTRLEAAIRSDLAGAPTRSFLAWHPAWGCFAGRFDLHCAGSVGESEGREPSLKAMIAAVKAGEGAGVRAVLVEPQEDDRHARVLADELHVDLVTVDPLGDLKSKDRATYGALMRFNGRAFAKALGADNSAKR